MPHILYSALFGAVRDPFNIYNDIQVAHHPNDLTKDGILLLHGGEDISPKLYGETCNKHCYKYEIGQRDVEEMALVDRAIKMDIPIIGICRGAQLLCAMDGGKLIQHVDGHTTGFHSLLDTRTGEVLSSNSCHHQVMIPRKHNTIIAVDRRTVNCVGENNTRFITEEVPEIVYYPKLNALAIQGHPEWLPKSPFQKYCTRLIYEFLLKE